MKLSAIILVFLFIPFANAHTDIPYYTYDTEYRPVYDHGTDVNFYGHGYYPSYNYYPYYNAGYRNGNLYEKWGYTTQHEISGSEYDSAYGYSGINDNYKTTESYERTIEYNYDRYGRYYSSYDPRYDERRSRTLYQDYYAPNLYGTGRIAIEDSYGPVYYNYRGQRYGYDAQGRRFYY